MPVYRYYAKGFSRDLKPKNTISQCLHCWTALILFGDPAGGREHTFLPWGKFVERACLWKNFRIKISVCQIKVTTGIPWKQIWLTISVFTWLAHMHGLLGRAIYKPSVVGTILAIKQHLWKEPNDARCLINNSYTSENPNSTVHCLKQTSSFKVTYGDCCYPMIPMRLLQWIWLELQAFSE